METQPTRTTDDDEMEKEFLVLAENLRAAPEQARAAYEHLCGIREEESNDPVVRHLHEEMERMSKQGFPIDRFIERVVRAEERERDFKNLKSRALEDYLHLVSSLPVSEHEQRVLYSIASKHRRGELVLYVDGQAAFDLETPLDEDSRVAAMKMTDVLKAWFAQVAPQNKVTIAFSQTD